MPPCLLRICTLLLVTAAWSLNAVGENLSSLPSLEAIQAPQFEASRHPCAALRGGSGNAVVTAVAPWWMFYDSLPSRWLRVLARGGWHAMRDVLFPELRRELAPADWHVADADVPIACSRITAIDWPLPGEASSDATARLALRAALLRAADSLGIPSLYAKRPEIVRGAAALILAAAVFALLAVSRLVTEIFARLLLRLLLRVTRSAAFVDDGSPSEEKLLLRYEDEAAWAAEAEALAARLRAQTQRRATAVEAASFEPTQIASKSQPSMSDTSSTSKVRGRGMNVKQERNDRAAVAGNSRTRARAGAGVRAVAAGTAASAVAAEASDNDGQRLRAGRSRRR